jgi:hypothetical protein
VLKVHAAAVPVENLDGHAKRVRVPEALRREHLP